MLTRNYCEYSTLRPLGDVEEDRMAAPTVADHLLARQRGWGVDTVFVLPTLPQQWTSRAAVRR
jgi:hypothetical protein